MAAALALLLHTAVAVWLLAARPGPEIALIEDSPLVWLPTLPPRLPPPIAEPLAATLEPIELIEPDVIVLPERVPRSSTTRPAPDWHGTARDVAAAFGSAPEYRRFGETPKAPAGRPKEVYPPSIYPKPLARVGKTMTTPEGETILWVSDRCFISLGSTSLTMQDFHKARQGIRRCQIGLGKKKPRDDLFDHLKKPPPPEQQEAGCGPDGIGQSCGR